MRADSGRMRRKSCRSDWRAISASAPASSTPVGPPPTMTKVSSRRCLSGSVSRSAASNASSTRRRISSASSSVFKPGARSAHSGWPKYACAAPVASDEVVVRSTRSRRRRDHPPSRPDRLISRVGQQHFDVLLMAQDPADRRRHIARRQRRGRDLIEQRLEQMVVVAIEERDLRVRAGERARRMQTAESAADDHDAREAHGSGF